MKASLMVLTAGLMFSPSPGVTEMKDICYGTERGYWVSMQGVEQDMKKAILKGIPKSLVKRELALTLDLYQPEGLSENRPLIMFIHGGTFYFGSKDEDAYVDFCTHFASLGYVTASINYRLGFHLNRRSASIAIENALHDAGMALDFLTANAEKYHIDKERVFVAGSSSGAITALSLAYGDGASGKDCRILAVANLWGAVSSPDIMQGSDVSVISFHGDCDRVVPYGEGQPMADVAAAVKIFPGAIYGSACIDAKAEELGLKHCLYTFNGEGHALNKDKNNELNSNQIFIKDKISEFFSHLAGRID